MPPWMTQVFRNHRLICRCAVTLAIAACFAGSGSTEWARAQSLQSRRVPYYRGRARFVPDTTQYPWSAVCKIVATFPDGSATEGTGTMIGAHHCLTALHLLYNTRTRVSADHIRIIPGYDDERFLEQGLNSHPFQTTGINQYLFWEPQDIAVIVTSSNIGEESSWMTVGSRTDRELFSQSYFLAGYPRPTNGVERQGSMTTSITRAEGDRVDLNADAPEGMEGGPIFELTERGRGGEQDTWSIVGVQTGPNRGTRIPQDMRNILRKFLRDDYSITRTRITPPSGPPRRQDRRIR